ncbi:FAD-binding oxidoreductase [Phytoactinopolyspora alkaliphila]|uniref:FAD-binding oxidoreductase n=2 Tax=Phytoactinopolyspora alkaliphila TaxID=1783498 RepID=A0A6N9YKX1_9ACTN|nr:FAD-binding oxidoreductase [Phytoactinopolyspora alkaliphila]
MVLGDRLHLPGEPGYDQARRPLMPVIDPQPAMVAEAAGVDDVRTAVVTAREHGLPFAVQATGHGTRVPSDGGILLKTGRMASVLVDPARRIARVGPGARWEQVLAAAAPLGLAPLSGSAPSVGVTGYSLGGGVGWLSRKHGFAADSMLRADVVLADGRRVTADSHRHSDLFWALRGGGGNFAVVTALEFRLYPVFQVYGGISYFAIERAADILARYRVWAETVPDEMSTAVVLTRMPGTDDIPEPLRGHRAVAIKVLHAGLAREADRLLRPLRSAAGPALHDGYQVMRYADAAMGGTPSRYFDYFATLPDSVVDQLVEGSGDDAAPTVEVRHWAGAMARPASGAGPAGHREAAFSVIVDAPRPGLADALRPHGFGASFLNFLGDPARVETAFTPANYRRLREIKAAYDPGNVLHVNLNIAPAGVAPAGHHAS